MYITKEELEKRLTKTEIQVKERERKTRKNKTDGGEERLDKEDRKIIGILSEIDTQKNVSELMGISQATVSNVSRGMITPQLGVDKELREEVDKGRAELAKDHTEKIKDQLLTNLATALGHIANNIGATDAPEASKIAVDMSKILDRVSGSPRHEGNKTAIIINVPPMKEEKHYQVINV